MEAGARLGPLCLTLEARWTHDERLLEGVGPGGADLGRLPSAGACSAGLPQPWMLRAGRVQVVV